MSTYKELVAQREALEKQIEEAMRAERAAAIATVRALVVEFGLTVAECGCATMGSAPKKAANVNKRVVASKFRGPNGETWSGRGRTPGWLAALEAQGQSRDRYRIA